MSVILFVCTANRFRSPIAAAYTESKLRSAGKLGAWVVRSAGTWTTNGEPAHPEAIKAAAELGLDLSTHLTHEVSTA